MTKTKIASAACLSVALATAVTLTSCDTVTAPQPVGTIEITISTIGVNIDLDVDGYLLQLDAQTARVAASSSTLTYTKVPVGRHTLNLDGIAPNCSLQEGSGRSVDVTDGATSLASFAVSCGANVGTITVTTATSGPDATTNRYSVTLPGRGPVGLDPNGTQTFTGVRAGTVGLTLQNVPENCVATGRNQTVTIPFGGAIEVGFVVECVAFGEVQMTASTTGEDFPNSYEVTVDAQQSSSRRIISVGANGPSTPLRLAPGTYVFNGNLLDNCTSVTPNPQAVTVAPVVLTTVELKVTCAHSPRFAYVSGTDSVDIWVAAANGTSRLRVTTQPGWDGDPAWSPDGKQIAFASERDGNREIYVMNGDGSNPVRLTFTNFSDYRPAWSPDGSRIAFVSERDGNAEIYLMNADGTNPVRLTDNPAFDGDPDWSPDGSRIAFRSARSGTGGIWIMDAEGSNAHQLTTNFLGDWQPAWSPDGLRIAFSHGVAGNIRDIFVINSDGSKQGALTHGLVDATDPSWSADGRRIAFGQVSQDCLGYYGRFYECTPYITVVNLANLIIETLPAETPAFNPTWQR